MNNNEGSSGVGLALTGAEQRNYDIRKVIAELHPVSFFELQPEDMIWRYEDFYPLGDKKFNVHAPTKGIDISSPDYDHRRKSIDYTIGAMNLANYVNAGFFVLHPVHQEGYFDPSERRRRRDIFLGSFSEIAAYRRENSHAYTLCLENVEPMKYPATLEELEEAAELCGDTDMLLDIPHIWNTQRVLQNQSDVLGNVPGLEEIRSQDLVRYIRAFLAKQSDRVPYYHVANFGDSPVRTHDPLNRNSLNPLLRDVLRSIPRKPIMLEIYRQSTSVMLESVKTIEGVFE